MFLVGTAIKGYAIEAEDGRMGTVSDLLFDDRTWKVRWLVADTGGWLSGRKVLIHPSAMGGADIARQMFPVRLTKAQVRGSPDIAQDEPVSKQMEDDLHSYYGWQPLWGTSYFGPGAIGTSMWPSPMLGDAMLQERRGPPLHSEDGDLHLRSMNEVVGYHVHATDGHIGHVENFIVDDESWGFRYFIVDTRNWWPGQHVLMSPYAIDEISWSYQAIKLDVTTARVKASPAWDPLAIIDRDYERRLHSYYEWPGYGW